MAEIVSGIAPAWYVLQIVPQQECIAAAHLAGRRFGIYLPQVMRVCDRTRKRRSELCLMFPGYCFVFAWLGGRNHERIRSCPGVWDFLRRVNGEPAVIADNLINAVRAIENKQRPLVIDCEAVGIMRTAKRRWRRFRRVVQDQQTIEDNQIIGVHTWSALHDGILSLDGHERNRLLVKALGC